MQGLKGKIFSVLKFDELMFTVQRMIAENLNNPEEAKRLRLFRNQLISLKKDLPHLFAYEPD